MVAEDRFGRSPLRIFALNLKVPEGLHLKHSFAKLALQTSINPEERSRATAAKEANFLSLTEPWANTSTAIGKLMITVLSGVAEFERDLIAREHRMSKTG